MPHPRAVGDAEPVETLWTVMAYTVAAALVLLPVFALARLWRANGPS
jgi:hypothetical protein